MKKNLARTSVLRSKCVNLNVRRSPVHLFGTMVIVGLGLPLVAGGHPMGNFSVNHYTRLYLEARGIELSYVMDLAEIPSFQLMEEWKVDGKDQQLLTKPAALQAKGWIDNLILTYAGQRIPFRIKSVSPTTGEGAAELPVLRISIAAEASLQPGEFTYADNNFPGRAGWKEIVVDHNPAVAIHESSQSNLDISKGLTYYPTDPSITPPQDVTAHVQWSVPAAKSDRTEVKSRKVVPSTSMPADAPGVLAATPVASFAAQQPDGPGSVTQGDLLSRLLRRKDLGLGALLLGVLAAFGLGAMHAMSPGHGKTIVAAYLVGSRGTLKHATVLGFVVTFTHTFTVFLLGLGMLFFQRYTAPERILPFLGSLSGMSIVVIGVVLLYRRGKALLDGGSDHSRSHDGYFHSHDMDQQGYSRRTRIAELRASERGETELVHSHGGSTHSHMIEGRITPGSLIALGISGGMVPCPSALILMLSAIALGHPGLGLALLVGFSSGLALVLMAFGVLAIYAKNLLPSSDERMQTPFFRLIPVFSSVVVICLGFIMTAVSAGWFKPLQFLS
jgi:nickel/cobalt exporter